MNSGILTKPGKACYNNRRSIIRKNEMTQTTTINPPAELESTPQCRHHWVIQPATGPMSLGVCQTCGMSREFKNYVEAAAWGDSRQAARASTAASEAVSRAVADYIDHEVEE